MAVSDYMVLHDDGLPEFPQGPVAAVRELPEVSRPVLRLAIVAARLARDLYSPRISQGDGSESQQLLVQMDARYVSGFDGFDRQAVPAVATVVRDSTGAPAVLAMIHPTIWESIMSRSNTYPME